MLYLKKKKYKKYKKKNKQTKKKKLKLDLTFKVLCALKQSIADKEFKTRDWKEDT